MWWQNYSTRQNDMHARYSAVKLIFFYSFYADSFFPKVYPWVNMTDTYLLCLYIAVIFTVFAGIQYEKTDITDEIIFFIFLKFVFLQVLTNLIVYLFFFFAGVFYTFKKIIFILFSIVRGIFIFWRPLFKKFGYLMTFFKKKKF